MNLVIIIVGIAALVGVHELARRVAPRFAFVVGTAASYGTAVVLAFALFMWVGFPSGPTLYQVAEVRAGYAAAGKLEVGDLIVALDHAPISADSDVLTAEVNRRDGAPIVLTIERDGATQDVTITPTRSTDTHGRPAWVLGIMPGADTRHDRDLGRAIRVAVTYPVRETIELAGMLFASSESADPGGPKRIYDEFKHAAPRSGWLAILVRLAVLAWLAYLVVDLVRLVVARYARKV